MKIGGYFKSPVNWVITFQKSVCPKVNYNILNLIFSSEDLCKFCIIWALEYPVVL